MHTHSLAPTEKCNVILLIDLHLQITSMKSDVTYSVWLLGTIRKSLLEISDREWNLILPDLIRYLIVEKRNGLFKKKANTAFFALRSKARALYMYLYVPHNRF